MTSIAPTTRNNLATADDVRRIIGELDVAKTLEIMALRPTIRDLEDASMFLAGDADVFGTGNPLHTPAGDIVAILAPEEEEEESRGRG